VSMTEPLGQPDEIETRGHLSSPSPRPPDR
jgi:hypothetical protein